MEFKLENSYLVYETKKFQIVFSTNEKGKNFNRHTNEGVKTLNLLKEEFKVEDVYYLKQIHSDNVYLYANELQREFIENEGDSIIAAKKGVAFGVFTADCVPVLLVHKEGLCLGAIHSGWKGTYKSITKKTINLMCEKFSIKSDDIKAFIGPHIRKCCYEVSNELKEKFLLKKTIGEKILFDDRKFSMLECIKEDLRESGILEENIIDLKLCTYCSENIKLHSYRKGKQDYGRMFSFIILK